MVLSSCEMLPPASALKNECIVLTLSQYGNKSPGNRSGVKGKDSRFRGLASPLGLNAASIAIHFYLQRDSAFPSNPHAMHTAILHQGLIYIF